jgi:hypothetical protein
MKRLLILSILLASLATEAKAGFEDGNELYSDCTSPEELHYGVCAGYVKGVADAGDHEAPLLDMRGGVISGFRWCLIHGITVRQSVDVVVRYLRDNPQKRYMGAAGLVAEALSQAWPCR